VTGGNAYAQCSVVKIISSRLQSSDQLYSIYCRSAPWLQSFALFLMLWLLWHCMHVARTKTTKDAELNPSLIVGPHCFKIFDKIKTFYRLRRVQITTW